MKQIEIKLERISNLMLAGLAIQLCKDGMTYDDICEALHISKSDVTKMLSGYQKARKTKKLNNH